MGLITAALALSFVGGMFFREPTSTPTANPNAPVVVAQGNNPDALRELDQAFRIEPGNVSVLKELGELAFELDDLKKSQQMYRALLLQRLDGTSPISKAEVFYALGRVHDKLGEKPKARQMLERALQTDANLEEAKRLLADLAE